MADVADTRRDGGGLRRLNFIVQQGSPVPDGASCDARYGSLLLQPRLVLGWTVIALLLGSAPLFAALGALLCFCAAVPEMNPFEALYNAVLARRRGGVRLTPAPAPRRFSQLLGGALSLTVACLYVFGHSGAARIVGVVFLAFVVSLAVAGFCFGSFVYHLLRGRWRFAWRSAPWGPGPD